jgi:hypothetical protein
MSGKEILQYSQIARILLGLYPEPVTGVQMTRNEWDSALHGKFVLFFCLYVDLPIGKKRTQSASDLF